LAARLADAALWADLLAEAALDAKAALLAAAEADLLADLDAKGLGINPKILEERL